MTCMCGDYYCSSCGPAQGNYHCLICGKWSADGGCDNPEECNKAADAYFEQLKEEWEDWEGWDKEDPKCV